MALEHLVPLFTFENSTNTPKSLFDLDSLIYLKNLFNRRAHAG